MKRVKILSVLLCLAMIVSMFAACGGNGDSDTSQVSSVDNDQFIDDKTGEIVNIGSTETMKITPEEIGTLSNPVVTSLMAWPSESSIQWKEEAYGFIMDYETCDGNQRLAKLIAAFVAGDSYDVFPMLSGDFPAIAQNGILQPLEKIMPVYDPEYFSQTVSEYYTWKGRCYGVKAGGSGANPYGVLYNKTLFDNAGEDTPKDYYDRGEWNWDTLKKVIKNMTNTTGSADDYYGMVINDSYLVQCSLASNGTNIVKKTDTGVELDYGNAVLESLNYTNEVREISLCDHAVALEYGIAGKTAMYIERPHQLNHLRNGSPQYEYGWVPFPVGPAGVDRAPCLADGWAICKGAKNIEGAMAWITCEPYYDTYAEQTNYNVVNTENPETRSEEELAFIKKYADNAVITSLEGYGFSAYSILIDSKEVGMAAAIEKYKPQHQAKLDELLGIQAAVGALDFEDQGVFNFDTQESEYPFVNVLADDKFTYGTDEITSLNIDLTGMTDFGAILHTKPELFKLQNGGQYKVSFKLYVESELDNETLALAAKTTDALSGDAVSMQWIENIKVKETNDVEVYFNINQTFDGDLAIVLMGSATEAAPELKLVIDDFQIELVKTQE